MTNPIGAGLRGPDPAHNGIDPIISDVESVGSDVPWLVHVIAIGNPILIFFTFYDDTPLCVHLSLMSVAFVFLLPEALILASKAQRSRHRLNLIKQHILVQFVTLLLSSLGLLYAFQYVRQSSPSFVDLNTYHSRVGAMTVSIFFLAFCIGFVMFSLPPELRRRLSVMAYVHKFAGKLTYILAIISILVALNIFETNHMIHRGWLTYLIASSLVAQIVGMEPILFPNRSFPKMLLSRTLSHKSDHFPNSNYPTVANGDA